MKHSWFVLLESNSTGTGQVFPRAARDANLLPIVFADQPERYPFLRTQEIPFLRINTRDFCKLRKAMGALVRHGLAGIYSSSEYYVETAARLAWEFGLPGAQPTAVGDCRNKYRMRQVLRRHGIPVPKFCCLSDPRQARKCIRHLSMPVVVKPTTGSGSAGVLLCRDRETAAAHANRILAQDRNERGMRTVRQVLIEEYIAGPEFSVESLGTDIIGITGKYLSPEPDFVEIGHDFPARIPEPFGSQVTEMVLRGLRAIGLTWGPAHTEVRLTSQGPRIIEINPRLAGGFIPEIVRLATGFDPIKATVLLASGKSVSTLHRHRRFSSIRFIMCPGNGVLRSVSGIAEATRIDSIADIRMYREPGNPISIHHDFRDRIGHVIAVAEREGESVLAAEEALQRISVAVEHGPDVAATEAHGRLLPASASFDSGV